MKSAILILVTSLCYSAHAQGTFQNLDFETANLTPVPAGQFGGEVPLSSALPDWGASIGGVSVTEALQNNFTITGASIDIFGPSWSGVNPGVIDGNYTVFLQSLVVPGINDQASIFQSGTESLQLKAWSVQSPATFSVTFNGTVISAVNLSSGQSSSGQTYTVYGFNIASYAGSSGQLQITAAVPSGDGQGEIEFDDISFSTQAVPEPSPFVLAGVGGALYALYRRFTPKRQ